MSNADFVADIQTLRAQNVGSGRNKNFPYLMLLKDHIRSVSRPYKGPGKRPDQWYQMWLLCHRNGFEQPACLHSFDKWKKLSQAIGDIENGAHREAVVFLAWAAWRSPDATREFYNQLKELGVRYHPYEVSGIHPPLDLEDPKAAYEQAVASVDIQEEKGAFEQLSFHQQMAKALGQGYHPHRIERDFEAFVGGNDRGYWELVSGAGKGKSSILASLYRRARDLLPNARAGIHFFRKFPGHPNENSVPNALHGLLAQIQMHGMAAPPKPQNYRHAVSTFENWLHVQASQGRIGKSKPVVLFLDGLDEIVGEGTPVPGAQLPEWMPSQLPEGVFIAFSNLLKRRCDLEFELRSPSFLSLSEAYLSQPDLVAVPPTLTPMHELERARMYVRIDSPSLISDVKVLCQNLIPPTTNKNSDYFEGRAREFLEGIILTLVRMHGVLTLGQLYSTVNLIPGGGDKWLDFAFEMSQAGFEVSARIEEEIANARQDSSSTGYQGIVGELFKALSCLSDPTLLRAVSPPFDFSLAQLCVHGRSTQLYIMPPAEFIAPWAPVIKALFVAGMIYKARQPQTPRQTWILDECAQLGGFPLVTQLFTYGAGIGIRPWAVFQSTYQMDQLGPKAGNIITSSAQVRSYFTIRDIETATTVSRMLGVQTLQYDDELAQARARHAKHQALQSMMSGGDPFMAGMSVAHYRREAEHRTKQQRLLRTPDEIMHTPNDKQYIFIDNLARPLYADRKPYYEQEFMAGRFHPNPYHPPETRVRVKTRWGHRWLEVRRENVPAQYADYPQYCSGVWSCVS